MAENKAEIIIDGNATGWRRAVQEMVQSAQTGTRQVESSFGGLTRIFGTVNGLMASLTAVFSGFAVAGVRAAVDAVDALNDVADATGASIEAISALQDTARRTGTGLEVVETSILKLNQALNAADPNSKQAAALNAIGLSADQLRNQDPADAVVTVAKALDQYADDGNKARLVQELFGRSLREVAPLLKDLAENGRGNATVTQEQARQAEAFNKQIFELQTNVGNASRALLLSFVPALSEVAEFTRRAQQEFGPFLGLLAGLSGGIYKAFGGTLNELKRADEEVQGLFSQRAEKLKQIEALQQSATSAVYGVTREAARKELGQARQDLADITAGLNAAIATRDKLQADARTGGKPPVKPSLPTLPGTPKASGADPSLMAYYEAALAEEKRLSAERDALREYTKQEELAYWQTLLQYADLNTKDRVAIEKKAADLAVAIAREEAKQKQALIAEDTRHREAQAMGELDARKAAARLALDLDQITKAQYLQIEEEFENRRWEIQKAALDERMLLLQADPNTNPVEYARLKNQILEAEQQHQLALQNIKGGQAKEEQDGGILGGISASFNRGLQTMMQGAQTWRDGIVQILTGIRNVFAQKTAEMVTDWLFGETTKTAATKTGAAVRVATETWAALKSVGAGAQAAIKNIMNSAWEAMAAAWKAIAGIPIVGPVLAPVVAGAAFAGVAALAGNISSAAGGYDIPRGLNPMTQLHEQEMVLPKSIANPLREMLAGGGGGPRGGPGEVRIINTTDPAVIRDWLQGPEGTQVITNTILAHPELVRRVAMG